MFTCDICVFKENNKNLLGVVVHTYTSALGRLRQKNLEFEVNLGYAVRLCLKKTKYICNVPCREALSGAHQKWPRQIQLIHDFSLHVSATFLDFISFTCQKMTSNKLNNRSLPVLIIYSFGAQNQQ
jgi:hypothetical protein